MGCCPSRPTSDPLTSACNPAPAPSATPGSVAATSEVVHPSANLSSSGAPSALITYGPSDVGPGQRPNDLRGKQLPAVRVGGGQFLQVDARAAVAPPDPVLAAVGPGHRPAQPQRRGEQVADRVRHLGPRPRQQLGHQLGGQLVVIGDRDIARVGNHGLAGRVGEVQRVAFVGGLELLPVQEDAVGQPVDSPAARRLDQLDRPRVGQHALGRLEHPHVGQRAQDVCPHGRRNPFGGTGFHEYHVVDQQRATGVVPGVGRRLGEELPRRQVPVGRIGCGLEEFAQQHVGIHARGRLGQIRRCRPVDGADGLRGRRAGYPGAAGKQQHGQTTAESRAVAALPAPFGGLAMALTVLAFRLQPVPRRLRRLRNRLHGQRAGGDLVAANQRKRQPEAGALARARPTPPAGPGAAARPRR